MTSERKKLAPKKTGLHRRNLHRDRYDFAALIQSSPELKGFVTVNRYGNESIDFSDPVAVKALNKALLMHFYGLQHWDIPDGFLCPPIPGRADYIHHMADLLATSNAGHVPKGRSVMVLDVGVGANAIYPIIGHRSYGWRFVGSDINPVATGSAQLIADANPVLKRAIECRLQKNPDDIFVGVIKPEERFDFTLCNPPFHSSQEEAHAGTRRKLKNLGRGPTKARNQPLVLNFGGQNDELWCAGGEAAFVGKMIQQSQQFAHNCLWFSTLVSKKDNLPEIYAALKKVKVAKFQTIEMAQGQKVSRIVVWTFLNDTERQTWGEERWG